LLNRNQFGNRHSSLDVRAVEVAELRLFASEGSVGKTQAFRGEHVRVQGLSEECFQGLDLVLFAASKHVSERYAPLAVKQGAVVVDNSSFFRMSPEVPLVVPEINGGDISQHRGIIANPNCTTAISLMALFPLHQLFGLQRVFASSYQAVSGTGQKAIAELSEQMVEMAHGRSVSAPRIYRHQILNNVIAQVDEFDEATGSTKEELKLLNEGRKILHLPSFRSSITCVRVPVQRAHSVSIVAQFERPISLEAAREALRGAPGVRYCEKNEDFPTPLQVSGSQLVWVGRLRIDSASDNGLALWVVGDQLLKGAAQNAVQIAEIVWQQQKQKKESK
jgi:aspartate-semialdehyde dehydrogenase